MEMLFQLLAVMLRNSRLRARWAVRAAVSAGACLAVFPAEAARIKDVARVEGSAETQLIGYGIVVGLRGTGDGPRTQFTTQSVINLLRNMGIELPRTRVQVRTAAAVMVTATLQPYQRKGAKLDITVSSMGDARSLEGGTLLLSPLQGPDGETYAMAQGPLAVSGSDFGGPGGLARRLQNHALVGGVPGGAIVQRQPPEVLALGDTLQVALAEPDYSSAVALAQAVAAKFPESRAEALDPAAVRMVVPAEFRGKRMEFLAQMEQVEFQPSLTARVVLNQKTGTVIAGGDVSISEVAVSHGNLTVEIGRSESSELQSAAAPGAVTQARAGRVDETVQAREGGGEMRVLPASGNVQELARSLNALGASPRDIIAIFEAIRKAGALHAELVMM